MDLWKSNGATTELSLEADSVSQNYRDELQDAEAKVAGERAARP
jgi:hypothetical protein